MSQLWPLFSISAVKAQAKLILTMILFDSMEKPIHNEKNFLLPYSPRSMACYHAKVMEDGIMKLTIHDCKGSIQLHNDLNDPEQAKEAYLKLESLAEGVKNLQEYICKYFDFK